MQVKQSYIFVTLISTLSLIDFSLSAQNFLFHYSLTVHGVLVGHCPQCMFYCWDQAPWLKEKNKIPGFYLIFFYWTKQLLFSLLVTQHCCFQLLGWIHCLQTILLSWFASAFFLLVTLTRCHLVIQKIRQPKYCASRLFLNQLVKKMCLTANEGYLVFVQCMKSLSSCLRLMQAHLVIVKVSRKAMHLNFVLSLILCGI